MGLDVVVVVDASRKSLEGRVGVWTEAHANIVAFEGFHEPSAMPLFSGLSTGVKQGMRPRLGQSRRSWLRH